MAVHPLKPHHLPQRLVHLGLPARPERAEAAEDFAVEAERDELLGIVRAGAAAPGECAVGGAEDLVAVAQLGAGEGFGIPFGRVIRIDPAARRIGLVRGHCISSSR